MPTYLITGGAGFIGSHLADALLARGCQVRVLDDFSTGRAENIDPRCDVMRGDVTDPAAVRRALEGTAGCFHLAAIASVARANEEWLATHRVNLGGTITVLDAARALGGLPVVYASSAAVYGNVAGVAHEALAPSPLTAPSDVTVPTPGAPAGPAPLPAVPATTDVSSSGQGPHGSRSTSTGSVWSIRTRPAASASGASTPCAGATSPCRSPGG